MKFYYNIKVKKVVFGILSVFALIGAVLLINSTGLISSESVREKVDSLGALGPLALTVLYALSVTFSPIAGSPFILAGLALYGFLPAFLCTYFGNIIGASVNFGIAKLVGRPIIRKLVGTKNMDEVDAIANMVGVKTLIILRIVGGAGFDIVSYAAGLTPMRFGIYILITIVCSVPSLLGLVYMFERALNLPRIFVIPLMVGILILAVVIPYFVYQRQRNRLKYKQDKHYNQGNSEDES